MKKIRIKSENNFYEEKAREFQKSLRDKSTPSEDYFKRYLDECNIKYVFQKIIYIRDLIGTIRNFYIVDFYLPEYKFIVEIDGSYHNFKGQKLLDIIREKNIKKHFPNIGFIRISNDKVKNFSYLNKKLNIIKR